MRMYSPRCRLPSGRPAAEMHTISRTVLSLFLRLHASFHLPLRYRASLFPLDFFCPFFPPLSWNLWNLTLVLGRTISLLHTQTRTHTRRILPLSACSLVVCTCGLRRWLKDSYFSFHSVYSTSLFSHPPSHHFLPPTSHLSLAT